MSKFSKFINTFKTVFSSIKEKIRKSYEWIGTDGIINMETSTILVMFLMLFLPIFWASVLTFIIITIKCILDKSKGSKKEKHDFICSLIGILFGVILGTIHVNVSLF